jgi:dTMP kinase
MNVYPNPGLNIAVGNANVPLRYMQQQGFFITFEGGEGAGKTTQISRLAERLRSQGRIAHTVREPGGTELGEDTRRILKHAPYGARLSDSAELLLFAASRAQLIAEVIRPALAKGEIVLCDRFTDSTAAYQGCGRGLPADVIAVVNAFATGGLHPDLTVLLDLPAAVGLERARRRAPDTATAENDRMETMQLAFYERVRAGYLELAARERERFLIVDALQSPDQIADQIWARLAATRNNSPGAVFPS